MKKITFIFMLLLGSVSILLTPACTNLDETVFSNFTDDVFPQTDEEIISALGVAYTSLYPLLNHNSLMSLNEVSSDEAMIPHRGADWFDGGQWLRVHRHEMNDNEESVNGGWNFCYGGISNCNRIIELLEGLVAENKVDEADAAAFISEVRVLRTLFYFWLLDTYGNVPIVTSFSDADPNPATQSRADVFAFVESELNENVPNLTRDKTGATYARINFWTGKHFRLNYC